VRGHLARRKLPECLDDDHEPHDGEIAGTIRPESLAGERGKNICAKNRANDAGDKQAPNQRSATLPKTRCERADAPVVKHSAA
jgi:hypothetical protein